METRRHEIGMIGLGVMGRNLLLNMADHGFPVAGYDKDPSKVEALRKESAGNDIHGATNIRDFIGLLRKPRAVMMLVPAGAAGGFGHRRSVAAPRTRAISSSTPATPTSKIQTCVPGNLTAKGIQFLGVGVSGGEEGARHGPSIMPGGPREAYERVRPIFEAIAAKVERRAVRQPTSAPARPAITSRWSTTASSTR